MKITSQELDRPWQRLDLDPRRTGDVFIGGERVPEGAFIELKSSSGSVTVQVISARIGGDAWLLLDLEGAEAQIPILVRLYDGVLARLSSTSEGRRD